MGEEQGDVSVRPEPLADAAAACSRSTIEDDGPGIPEDKAREALKRGKRLDETKPGTGLGLAIVSDLVNEYGGKLRSSASDLGGLKRSRPAAPRRVDGRQDASRMAAAAKFRPQYRTLVAAASASMPQSRP